MHILLLTDGISPFVTGGMQRHSANLAKYFTLEGVKVTLVHCLPFGEKLPQDDKVNIALFGSENNKLHKVHTLNFPKKGKMIGHYVKESYRYSEQLYNLLDFSEFDFVYAKGFCGWYYMEQKKKGVSLPPIGVKFHGYEMFQELSSFSQKLKAFLLKSPTRWNNEHADFVFSYGGKITELILNVFNVSSDQILEFTSGIDNDWIRKSDPVLRKGKIKFVFVGRDEKRKGVNDLNKALKELLNHIDFEFHFIGPIPQDKKIENNAITYHGELKNKESLIAVLDEMDILVCPSHSEGMPNVILEGMARGLAVLATDVGAVEFVVDSNNGKIISPLNQQILNASIKEFAQIERRNLLEMKLNSLKKIENKYLWNKLAYSVIQKINTIVETNKEFKG